MPAITLDSDLIAATELQIRRIETQQYRNALTAKAAQAAEELALGREELDLARTHGALSLREQITLAIADKYMTTSTSTVPATVLADAQNDAARLKAAVDEVLKTLA